jgi:predicted permease
MMGCVAGLVFAWVVSNIVVTYLASQLFAPISANLQFHLDGRMMAFTGAISVFTGLFFGIAPALRLTRIDLGPALQGGSSPTGSAFSRQRLDKILMAGQVALSLVLLIVAGLFVRTLQNLNSIDVGFGGKNLWQMPLGLESSGYRPAQMPVLYQEMIEKVSSLPGVESASLSESGLMTDRGSGICCLSADGEEPRGTGNGRVRYDLVSAGFFETAGFQLLSGRGITGQDTDGGPLVVVINEQLARDYFRDQNPVGRRMSFSGQSGLKPIEVIGVVKNAKYDSLRSRPQNFIYLPYDQHRTMGVPSFLEIRTKGEPFGVIANVRREVLATARNLLIMKTSSIAEQLDDSIAEERMIVKLSGFFSLLALLLASVGLYGVMSYAVSRKTREIGIRMALGARPNQVLLAVLQESMLMVIIGIVAGIGVALATTRFISSLLFGVGHYDPLTISAATLLLIAVALIASYLPARRASLVHPMLALRYE